MFTRYVSAALIAASVVISHAFIPAKLAPGRSATRFPASTLSMSSSADADAVSSKKIIVISPPGGVGEVAAVTAAKLGNSVRWFVVSPPDSSAAVSLPASVLEDIASAGGAIELAGADASSLLLPSDDASSAIGAVSKWCGSADGLVCTHDVEGTVAVASDVADTVMDAVKVASREAAGLVAKSGRVAVLPAPTIDAEEEEENESGGAGGLFSSLLGGSSVDIPSSLEAAIGDGALKVTKLRHGELFGIPESSPEASPFVGGPRRDPQIRDEYTMRSVRVDPTISASGTAMMGSTTRSSRLAVGEAAARVASKSAPLEEGSDVFLTSLNGVDILDSSDWSDEFKRCEEMMSSGAGAQLFKETFESVPDTERLTDWIATKWAPAVLRTYDIAGIRVGARPVYASKIGETTVEITWQKLVDFQSVTVGKMLIEISDDSIAAKRGPGDASAGYGSISLKPLAGEDVLVRRLADAASQAIEKGLAKKPAATKKPKPEPKKVVVATPVTTTVSSGDVVQAKGPASLESGPRTAGARRSSERARGKRRKSPPKPATAAEESSDAFQ